MVNDKEKSVQRTSLIIRAKLVTIECEIPGETRLDVE